MTQQNWPARYKCPKCTRITDSYPFGCNNEDCPVKRDVLNDIRWQLTVGFPLTIIVVAVVVGIAIMLGGSK